MGESQGLLAEVSNWGTETKERPGIIVVSLKVPVPPPPACAPTHLVPSELLLVGKVLCAA